MCYAKITQPVLGIAGFELRPSFILCIYGPEHYNGAWYVEQASFEFTEIYYAWKCWD